MIKEILKNEIKYIIGHVPSDAEYKSALEYLSDRIESHHTLTDVEVLLKDWRDEELVKCQECGDYFLPEMLEEREVPWCCYETIMVCSDSCFNDYCKFQEPETPEISQHI